MKHALPIIIAFLLTFSLASAVSIQIAKTDYAQGETLTAMVSGCAARSVLEIYNAKTPIPNLIYIRQGQAQWSATYNTDSDTSDGKYTLSVSCEDGTTAEQAFCVDMRGCTDTQGQLPPTQPPGAPAQLSITSSAFGTGDIIPEQYACGPSGMAVGVSPPLEVRNIPTGTQSLTLVMEDIDIDLNPAVNPEIPQVHWAVYNIPVTAGATQLTIPAGVTFSATAVVTPSVLRGTQSVNEITRSAQYAPPCPPPGTTHRYRFVIYTFNISSLPVGPRSAITVLDEQGILRSSLLRDSRYLLQQTSLTGLYYPPPPPAPAPSGGGGSRCRPNWNCPSQWSYCNATLQQSRICTDLNRCDQRKLTKMENRSCTACEESWVCTPWDACRNGQQMRNCVDEHNCGVTLQKPVLQKSCQQIVEPGPVPVRVQPQLPPSVQQPAPSPSFWNQYKWLITGIPAAILVIIVIIFGVVHAFRSKSKPAAAVEYDMKELKEWVRKEKSMGTSDKDVITMLAQHTGWSTEEVENKFTELKENDSGSASVTSPAG